MKAYRPRPVIRQRVRGRRVKAAVQLLLVPSSQLAVGAGRAASPLLLLLFLYSPSSFLRLTSHSLAFG